MLFCGAFYGDSSGASLRVVRVLLLRVLFWLLFASVFVGGERDLPKLTSVVRERNRAGTEPFLMLNDCAFAPSTARPKPGRLADYIEPGLEALIRKLL